MSARRPTGIPTLRCGWKSTQRDRERRATFGIVAGLDGATMSIDDRSRDREPYSEAVRFRRDEWCEQRADDIRGQTRSSVAHGDFESGGSDFACYRDLPPGERHLGHRVHGVYHQVHEHLLQEHLIAIDYARTRRRIDVHH